MTIHTYWRNGVFDTVAFRVGFERSREARISVLRYRKGDLVAASREIDGMNVPVVPRGTRGRVLKTTLFGRPKRVFFAVSDLEFRSLTPVAPVIFGAFVAMPGVSP